MQGSLRHFPWENVLDGECAEVKLSQSKGSHRIILLCPGVLLQHALSIAQRAAHRPPGWTALLSLLTLSSGFLSHCKSLKDIILMNYDVHVALVCAALLAGSKQYS